jgi:signal transduction histidine kinase
MTDTGPDRSAALVDVGLALASELSVEVVLRRIVEAAARVTGARYAALGVLGRDESISEFITFGITHEERLRLGHPPTGRGILGALISHPVPLRLPDLTADPRSVGFPPNHPPMRSFLGAPVISRGRVFGNIYLCDKQGAAEFSGQDEHDVLILAAQAGVAIENARLYEDTDRQKRLLEVIGDVTSAILEGGDPDRVLELIAEGAYVLTDADLASVAAPDPDDGSYLVVRAALGEAEAELRGARFAAADSISGSVIRTGKPAVVADASAERSSSQPVVQLGTIGPAAFVPLAAGGMVFGTLTIGRLRDRAPFRETDLELIESLASQAAVAIEYARARAEVERMILIEDRERIGKDLHDGAIQSLFAVGMTLQASADLLPAGRVKERIDRAVEEIDRVIGDLRSYIFGLRPGILAGRELREALRSLAEEFEARSGITTVCEVEPAAASEVTRHADDLVQISREALSNIERHAGAQTCRITLSKRDGSVLLEIDDDGRGLDLRTAMGAGQGLENIRQRASSMSGSLEVESDAASGTTVRLIIPG